jgi:7-carboxy-7-deazaguanine synthase
MSAEEIVEACENIGCKSITITGGEPLIHPGINTLVGMLLEHKFWVNIETNGTMKPLERKSPFLFYTMDYKLEGSGMTDRVNIEPLLHLTQHDVVKFVVSSEEDMEQALGVIEEMRDESDEAIEMPQVFFSPVFGAIEPEKIVRFMQNHKLWFAKVQLQLHKFIWPPEQRGV